jgi:hypothetical protein
VKHSCPRSHRLLRLRDGTHKIEDLSGEMRAAHADAVARKCGCDHAPRYVRVFSAAAPSEDTDGAA